jgi:hypothetical protein
MSAYKTDNVQYLKTKMRRPEAAMLEAQLVNSINKFKGFKEFTLHILKFSRRLTEATVDASEGRRL